MPPSFPSAWSLESTRIYSWGVDAGLSADERTEYLAIRWREFDGVLAAAIAARDTARQKTARAEARTRVLDARFDAGITLLSGTAHLAAGKDEKAEPYHSLFGTVPASDARNFGPHKASIIGRNVLAAARTLAHAALAPLLTGFADLVDRLAASGVAREEAQREEKQHDIERARLIGQAEALAAETEVALLGLFLGQPEAKAVVRAILAVPRPEKKDKDDEQPGAPA